MKNRKLIDFVIKCEIFIIVHNDFSFVMTEMVLLKKVVDKNFSTRDNRDSPSHVSHFTRLNRRIFRSHYFCKYVCNVFLF